MPADTHDTTIRRLEPHDQGAYRALRLESLRTNPALFGTTYAEAAAMPSLPFETFIRERAPDHAMFGAFVDGTLVGLCGFRRETRERARHSGELVEMYVAPHVAGRGIGARLVDAVLRFAFEELGASQVVLGVAAENERAQRGYRRAGFREYGRLPNAFLTDGVFSAKVFMVRDRE